MLRIALIVNPLAGIGGAVGLKGSDGRALQAEALARFGQARGESRALQFLNLLKSLLDVHALPDPASSRAVPVSWMAPDGPMGGQVLGACGLDYEVLSSPGTETEAGDTAEAVGYAQAAGADLIAFVGGDGTARDVLSTAEVGQPFLGIPAGVKMHSGVFAINPNMAAQLVDELIRGGLVSVQARDVRDFDDDGDAASIRTKYYGELSVPELGRFLQQTKVAGIESEELAVEEIVADIVEQTTGRNVLVGPGSTCLAIKRALGLDPAGTTSILGFDGLVEGHWHHDVADRDLAQILNRLDGAQLQVILSFTRGQGFLLGRGNQQLTPAILGRLDWPQDFTIVGTRTKLLSLEGRPLLIDTNDEKLDASFAGLVSVTTGYEDHLLYRVTAEA